MLRQHGELIRKGKSCSYAAVRVVNTCVDDVPPTQDAGSCWRTHWLDIVIVQNYTCLRQCINIWCGNLLRSVERYILQIAKKWRGKEKLQNKKKSTILKRVQSSATGKFKKVAHGQKQTGKLKSRASKKSNKALKMSDKREIPKNEENLPPPNITSAPTFQEKNPQGQLQTSQRRRNEEDQSDDLCLLCGKNVRLGVCNCNMSPSIPVRALMRKNGY